ncbi:hypothetical protein [uncultured Pseudokineococcus sp.]|uniref:hypothetical protein n=1 Tax=uncultured Pseudokineococcus sp. TaxID=1642928 RepID=UPI00262E1C62|nr:hypothetical protein [uncultured Pseudokineococcus sp.]
MSTDSSTTGDEQDHADSDGDPQEMPERQEVTAAVDGVAEDDTDPGSDPDGDPAEMTSSS